MARYLVPSGSTFTPLTFEEMAKPVVAMDQAYNTTQEMYDTLDLETNALANYISNNPEDSDARLMYSRYMNQLQTLQNDLWKNGVTAQTRRQLSSARAGYAKNIKPIADAIQARQDRSKEYWDTKHKNPDMVMGTDPGLAGLNSYLQNPNYGRDYYTYSGTQFSSEVGADAKARINELFKDPTVNKSKLAGYIEVMTREGANSAEVQKAAAAVRQYLGGDVGAYNSLGDKTPEKILADVLISNMNSTGARGNVDSGEFNRLIEYGVKGLSQAIGETKTQYLNDVEDEYRRKKDFEKWKVDLANTKTQTTDATYNSGSTIPVRPPVYDKYVNMTTSEARGYKNGAVTITLPDGTPFTAKNEYELTREIYNSPERERWRVALGGYDLATEPERNKSYVFVDRRNPENPVKHTVTITRAKTKEEKEYFGEDGLVIKENGRILRNMSNDLNEARSNYFERVSAIVDGNKDKVNVTKYSMSPEKQKKMRDEVEFPVTASWDDFVSAMNAQSPGDYSPGILASSDSSHGYALTDIANESVGQYKSAPVGHSRRKVYKVNDNGMTHAEKPTDYVSVVGESDEGNTPNAKNLKLITLPVENMLYDIPMVRFQADGVDGSYDAYPELFGPTVDNEINSNNKIVYSEPLNQEIVLSTAGAVKKIMEPILHPERIWSMGSREIAEWGYWCYAILGSDPRKFPVKEVSGADGKPSGQYVPITPYDVLRDNNRIYANIIYSSVVNEILNPAMQRIRVAYNTRHEQHHSNTSSKVESTFPIE